MHAPETWFHYTGKRLVGAWAQERYPQARVVDREAVSNRQVPCSSSSFPDGRRFAFEIQYAALTEDEWTWRHAGYFVQGIVDIWRSAHLPRYLRRDRTFDGLRCHPRDLTAIAASSRPDWINPPRGSSGRVGALSDEGWRGAFEYGANPDEARCISLAFDALADCRIEGGAFLTPLDDAEGSLIEAAEARKRQVIETRRRGRRPSGLERRTASAAAVAGATATPRAGRGICPFNPALGQSRPQGAHVI